MADDDRARVYGAPDPDNQQPPAKQGLRGEQGAAKPIRTDLIHDERMPDGDTIEIEEQSGTAFAEVTGAADGKDPDEIKDR